MATYIKVNGHDVAVVCPSNRRSPDDIVGCGSTHVQPCADEPNLFECECGMWFTEEEAREFLIHGRGCF